MGNYYYKKGWHTQYAVTPKCGSSAIHDALTPEGFENRDKAISNKAVYLTVRHPLDRLVSSWSFFSNHYHRTGPTPELTFEKDISLADYFEWTKDNPNKHWIAQTEQHPKWRYYRLIPLQTITETWDHIGAGEITHTRKSTHNNWESYYDTELLRKVSVYYSEDCLMWWVANRKSHTVRYIYIDGVYRHQRSHAISLSYLMQKRSRLLQTYR